MIYAVIKSLSDGSEVGSTCKKSEMIVAKYSFPVATDRIEVGERCNRRATVVADYEMLMVSDGSKVKPQA